MSNANLESEVRQKIIEAIRMDLLGPSKPDELLSGRPNIEYITGFLAPDNEIMYDYGDDEFIDANKYDSDKPEENLSEKNDKQLINTSSIGLSFYVEKNTSNIKVNCSWGDYFSKKVEKNYENLEEVDSSKKKEIIKYQRENVYETFDFDLSKINKSISKRTVSGVEVSVIKYNLKSGYSLVSIFMVNKRPNNNEVESMMFQVKMEIECEQGFVSESFARNNSFDDEYYYIEKPIFARGRGCAATWNNDGLICRKISTEFIPEQEINKVSADFNEFPKNFFSTLKFSIVKNKNQNISDLKLFAEKYQDWINELKLSPKIKYFNGKMNNFNVIISKCQNAHDRILAGINSLENDLIAYEAFEIMNRIIYTQNAIKRFSKKHADVECKLEDFLKADELIDFDKSANKFCWRPFQLAFILLNINGIIHPEHSERNIVDLLYFPTGGGKTEAYLGLMAFTIVNRRLRRDSNTDYNLDGGVTIILRYTLRLLTTQQRDRLTKMIVAAEYLRLKNPSLLGNERISIGFWVGDSVVPNKFIDFKPDKDGNATDSEKRKKDAAKQVPTCPFCGKHLNYYPEWDANHNQTENSFIFDANRNELKMYCLDKECFYTKYPTNREAYSLPIYLVDEEIYYKCPTIVLGTVDKFATLPWNIKTNTLFGRVNRKCDREGYIAIGDNSHPKKHNAIKDVLPSQCSHMVKQFLPPELIVQDELHLITGPLGTIYGGYETMIEHLCTYSINGKEIRPKYIVSTATIKNASEQINALYGRKFFQFPPSGLDAADSYFIREVSLEKEPFRKYIGICANGSSMKTTLLRTFAAVLQETKNLSEDPRYSSVIDPYYTLVGYFNSIRELGGAARLIQDDIPDRIKRICKMHGYSHQRYIQNSKEITSRISSEKIKEELDRLEMDVYKNKSKCIDTVIATNMIAVGMDVDRLGLMCVLGQPKQNSEYIQATSRIGRSHPGLVITLYNPYRPRDLSHYENFAAYHKQLYRYVEGTTATPFAARARDRVLHALVIMAIRMYYENMSEEPKNINSMSDKEINDIIDIIIRRMSIVDPSAINDGKREINYFISEWKKEVSSGVDVVYSGSYKEDRTRLLVPFSDYRSTTEKGTLQSMREVDQSSGLYLLEED